MANFIPGVAQMKAWIQRLTGDDAGALETEEDFYTKTPVVSHFLAACGKLSGNDDFSEKCWRNGNASLDAMADSLPVVGHVKGVVHLATGNEEAARRSFKEATRTTWIMGGGGVGFVVGGPLGAAAGGGMAGFAADTTEWISSAGETSRGVYRLVENPTDPWEYLDCGIHLSSDCLAGYSGAKVTERGLRGSEIGTAKRYASERASRNLPKDGRAHAARRTREVYSEVKDRRTGQLSHGHNKTMRGTFQENVAEGQNRFISQYGDPRHPNLGGRSGQTCAEAQAYHNHLGRNGAAPTTRTRVNTIEVRQNGRMYNIERCENCKANSNHMGKCNTDPGVLWYSKPRRIPSSKEWATRGGSAAVPSLVAARKHRD